MSKMNRREFLKQAGGAAMVATLPVTLVKSVFADPKQNFTFAYISDSHIQHIKGNKFVRNWDMGLKRAVAEVNLMVPRPDFVVYGGDLAQLGKREELDHGAEILSGLNMEKKKVHYVLGEHDFYLDMGEYWEKNLGPQWKSFDHKGVHFIILNSILTDEKWIKKWPTPERRMHEMAGLDNPNGSPFEVGAKQREWLKKDLAKVSKNTPIVVFSHSPLQKIFKGWNFWTDDAEQIQALLRPFNKVTVFYGHVHQIQYNQIGNISFHSVMATAWPWPYPRSYAQAKNAMPVLTVPMNRADPFFERDATGWQFIDVHTGNAAAHYQLPNNANRTVKFNPARGRPEDTKYQSRRKRIPPQTHY